MVFYLHLCLTPFASVVIVRCNLHFPLKYSISDPPAEQEGFLIRETTSALTVQSSHKLEVPGLLIQWEALTTLLEKDEDKNLPVIVKLMHDWHTQNPCGRVILICDGTSAGTYIYAN